MKLHPWIAKHPLWVIVIVALSVRILPVFVRFVIGSDDALFMTLGQSLAAGQGYTGDGRTIQIDFPPGYPLFVAAIYSLGGTLELPTVLNMLLIGSLLPLVIYWLTTQLINPRTAFLAGLLVALQPALVLGQGNFESVAEQPYALLLYTGWGVLCWSLNHRDRWWMFGLAGLLIGMAHLVRWEGIIMGIIAGAIIVLVMWRDRRLPNALVLFFIGLALFAIPYALFLAKHTHSYLSPKTMLTQLHAAAIDATASDPFAFERSFYQHYESWLANPTQPPQVVADSRSASLQRYTGNVIHQIRLWFTSFSLLTLLWVVPFVTGFLTMPWRGTLFLLPLFLPLAAIPASVVDPRYFLVPLPVMMIFVATGLIWLADRLPLLHPSILPWSLPLGRLLLVAMLLLFLLASLAGPFFYPRPTAYRLAGLALRGKIPSGAHMLARKRQLPFYANGVWEWLPYAELDEVLAYAIAHQADYLVLDIYTTPELRPQLAHLLDPAAAPTNLVPVYVAEDGTVVVYKIE